MVIAYNRWIERQRQVAHNFRLQRKNQDEPCNPGEGLVPEGVERISRIFVLDIKAAET